ncbi:restriction endonuclease [Comamonas flocculans]|nr:restriction endonuclease [Comamonas flocculans]
MTSEHTSRPVWMVRAGEGASLIEDFRTQSLVAIGWSALGDLSRYATRADFALAVEQAMPELKPGQRASAAGQTYRFVHEIAVSDHVVSYDPDSRVYLLGSITGAYAYRPAHLAEFPNERSVRWLGSVPRDALSVAARNSLGAISTLFLLPPQVGQEVLSRLSQPSAKPHESVQPTQTEEDSQEDIYRDVQSKGFEFIKDKVNALDWEDMQELVASLLRAMGYKTRISPKGSDRGKDIVASPDGFGFEDPRIVVEVKHREGSAIGSQQIRSFLGGRHDHDKGLYVSTGGFTKDARYEAERGRIPVMLMDLDDLVRALLEHYERMDVEMQRLVPLRKVYWPA